MQERGGVVKIPIHLDEISILNLQIKVQCAILGPVYTMDHEAGPQKDGLFHWSEFMVQLPWFEFLKKGFESLRPLARCKPNLDQEERPCTKE